MIKKIKKSFIKSKNKFKKLSFNKIKYRNYIKRLPVCDKSILLESQHGRTFNGNMFYLLKELASNSLYEDYKIYYTVKDSNQKLVEDVLENYKLKGVKTLLLDSKEYYRIVATSKYLFNDTSFLPFFIKRDEQVYLNTWHGTPLKTLGKKSHADSYILGNIQRNFILADYLLYPNEFTMNLMVNDYMIKNLSHAKILLGGYPRNSIFFDGSIKNKVRDYYEIEDDIQIIAYMPTYRNHNVPLGKNIENTYTLYHLLELDKKLSEKQVMYVNIHPLAGQQINYKMFKHIKPMPKDFETYEFLAATDCLITDYSSVMFDYVLSKNKIILFTYDKNEYLENRGMYLDMNDLPFPMVSDTDNLAKEIASPKNYNDNYFINEFCKYDNLDICDKICRTVVLGEENLIKSKNLEKNNKENVLIYVGNMAKNGITASIKNLLINLDLKERNYYINYIPRKVKSHLTQFEELTSLVNYIPMQGKMILTFKEEVIYHLFSKGIISATTMSKYLDEAYKYEIKRLFGNASFSHAIQFCGYEKSPIMKYSKIPCNNVIYVHNNMVEEIRTKSNQRKDVLSYAYKEYDKVSLVTHDMMESVDHFYSNSNKLVANNIIDYKRVLNLAQQPFSLDEDTKLNMNLNKFINILNSDSKKFINIGRFSKEKGHLRLIDSFEKVWREHNDSYLIIIGGYGSLYKETLEYAANKICSDNIIIIKSMTNPFVVLKKCDYFVLSSYHEGFGIVIAEADILGLSVISTNIDGPKQFMIQNGGTLVDNSTDGLYQGMIDLINSNVKCMNVNYEEYNKNAIKQFNKLLS
ncbi:MAG: CDP-glycerol glycerophosphotransferase family protein [Terrisporobacter sp.]